MRKIIASANPFQVYVLRLIDDNPDGYGSIDESDYLFYARDYQDAKNQLAQYQDFLESMWGRATVEDFTSFTMGEVTDPGDDVYSNLEAVVQNNFSEELIEDDIPYLN